MFNAISKCFGNTAQREILCVKIALSTDLEASSLRIVQDRALTLCSVNIPLQVYFDIQVILSFSNHLRALFMDLCYLNAHHALWGSVHAHSRGIAIERLLLPPHVCL